MDDETTPEQAPEEMISEGAPVGPPEPLELPEPLQPPEPVEPDQPLIPLGLEAVPQRPVGRFIVIGIAILALATLGGIIAFKSSGGADPAASRVPRDTVAFFQLTLDLSDDQRGQLDQILGRLPGGGTTARGFIEGFFDGVFEDAPAGLDRASIEAWLGDQIAFALPTIPSDQTEPEPILLIQVSDPDAAREDLDLIPETTVEISKGWAYVASSQELIDAFQKQASEDPLIRDKAFRDARDAVGGDGVLLARINAAKIPGFSALPIGLTGASQTVVLGARFTDQGLTVSGSAPAATETRQQAPSQLEALPGDVLAALSFVDLGGGLENSLAAVSGQGADLESLAQQLGLDFDRVTSWLRGETTIVLGDVPLRGSGPDAQPSFGAIIEVTDRPAMRETMQTLRGLISLGALGPDVHIEGEPTVRGPRPPANFQIVTGETTISVREADGRLIVATPPAFAGALARPSLETLGETPAYRRMFGPSNPISMQFFVNFAQIATLFPPDAQPLFLFIDGLGAEARTENGISVFELKITAREG